MNIKASGGSPIAQPRLYRTASISTIVQAEQQDRFLQLEELNQITVFLNSGNKRLEIADLLAKNANILVSKAADKIFIGGSAISYLERPQASVLLPESVSLDGGNEQAKLIGDTSSSLSSVGSLFQTGDVAPPGFQPINVARYGSVRMKKSLRDLDWFLRYLTYAILAGDPNILSVNIRGLRELIDNACSSAAATVALREMRKIAVNIFSDAESKDLVVEYFNVIITEFEASSLTDTIRKRTFGDSQGLRLPQTYVQAGDSVPRFVMKNTLSAIEKDTVIAACYRQIFERDIAKAYGFCLSDLESRVKNGQISIKEFIRSLGKSDAYRQDFLQPLVNSRALELAFRHFLGRGLSSLEEFQKFFTILSSRGLAGLVDSLLNSDEYSDYFGEETVPYLRSLGEEPQECRNWGPQIQLFNFGARFRKIPQFVTLFSNYNKPLPSQHPYGQGHDYLPIQFGAIFPSARVNCKSRPAPFNKDVRRLLIRRGPGIYNQIGNPSLRCKVLSILGPVVFSLSDNTSTESNVVSSMDAVLDACYMRVFGRKVYQEELLLLNRQEDVFKNGKLSVRDFVRYLAKSSVYRSLYWEPLFLCKAIEYLHNRLLGRPTYGRQEINKYFEIAYRYSYYKVVDTMIDSEEYSDSFGDSTVPYERYLTAAGFSMRAFRQRALPSFSAENKFIKLGQVVEARSTSNIHRRITQGVSTRRDQKITFQDNHSSNRQDLEKLLRAAYRQVFERDIALLTLGYEFVGLEKAFLTGELTVKHLITKLGLSSVYRKEFHDPYPNTKVIELGTKHFLGRAPNNQAEIRYYNQILASQGIISFVNTLISTVEYDLLFGNSTVPYRRFPTLPAANFPNTEKLYNMQTKQDARIVVPSFKSVAGNQ